MRINFFKYWNLNGDYSWQVYNEIETNGTVVIEDDLFSYLNQINCSPKLANSGMSVKQRIVPDAIKRIMQHGNYQFKFVISTEEDVQELRSAMGSVYDRNNAFAISSVEFLYNSGSTTTVAAPGKFYIGTSVEKLNSDSLLTGISTQNSPISYRISTGTATAQVHTITLVVNYDALFEIDTVNRQTALKA